MKLDFCQDSENSKPHVVCVDYAGEISCFELGKIPPQPDDPKKLGIVFPCCVNNKEKSRKDENKKMKYDKENAVKKVKENRNVKPKNTNDKLMKEDKMSDRIKNTSIVYVFDTEGLSKIISYVKAKTDCEINKVSKRKKSSDKLQKRTLSDLFRGGKSLHICKSRELRGGILYTDCFCLRRNGLQYDCRRSGCQNSPLCSLLPAPACEPSRVACMTHCANPHAEELSTICKLRPWQ